MAGQLAEQLYNASTRQAFRDYATWLVRHVQPRRAALALKRHCTFFVRLDEHSAPEWCGTKLLEVFGTKGLRQYETPVRWLTELSKVTFTAQQRLDAAELGRARKLVATFAADTVAYVVAAEFEASLLHRFNSGEIKSRSVRMALRPAIALLKTTDARGARLPDQQAVERFLASSPGQRAALSTFLGFLRTSKTISLLLPKKKPPKLRISSKDSEKQLAALMRESQELPDFNIRWIQVALAYFHRLTATQALKLCNSGAVDTVLGGFVVNVDSKDYWIPAPIKPS